MRIYQNCEELSIHLFHKVVETGVLLWLIEGYSEGKQFNPKENLLQVWENIYKEYCDLTDDNQSLTFFKLNQRIIYLETRIYMCHALVLQMVERRGSMSKEIVAQYIENIRSWGVPYRKEKYDAGELEKVIRFLRLTENELGLKKNELQRMKSNDGVVPLTKQVVMAEQALGRNMIDPKTTSVAKWVYMMQVIEQKNQERKKNGRQL